MMGKRMESRERKEPNKKDERKRQKVFEFMKKNEMNYRGYLSLKNF